MTDFKDKLKMFESNKTSPQIKSKPVISHISPNSKIDEVDGGNIKITSTIGNSLLSSENMIILTNNDSFIPNCDLNDGDLDDYSFAFLESVYDLPGFEKFYFDIQTLEPLDSIKSISLPFELPKENDSLNSLSQFNEVECRHDNAIEDIQLAPSSKLIEEIFNTSIWRNSENYSDDFVFNTSLTIDAPVNTSDRVSDIPLALEDRRKTQSSGRRSIFSSIFKSKKGSKKSAEKITLKDNSDNDSLKEYSEKPKSNNKNHTDDDNKSVDLEPKKPLNSMFNRDWLNNIGDGIKKKATVMSELRKVFTHGKFKNFRKISHKNSYDITA